MKRNLIAAFLIMAGAPALSESLSHPQDSGLEPDTAVLTIDVSGFESDEGVLMLAMWNSEEGFLERDPYRYAEVDIEGGKSRVVFEGVAFGRYGISVYHDKNDNAKLDTGLFRIPKEAFGFSNDAMGRMGPPNFDKASFVIESHNVIHPIKLKKF